MIEDRRDDGATTRERLADLDLAVGALVTAVELEDAQRLCDAPDDDGGAVPEA